MGNAFVEVEYDTLNDKKFDVALFMFFVDNSVFNGEERVLEKEELNMSAIADRLNTGNRKTLEKRFAHMLKNYRRLMVKDDAGNLILKDAEGFTISLSHETMKSLTHVFSSDTIKIYLYLYRQDSYWKMMRGECFVFSWKQLCEAIGLRYHDTNVKKVQKIVMELVLNGLVTYENVQKGRVNYQKVISVRREFTLMDEMLKRRKSKRIIGYVEGRFLDGE